MPHASIEAAEPQESAPRQASGNRRRWFRWFRWLLLGALVVFIAPYPVSRWLAESYRVQLIELPVVDTHRFEIAGSNRDSIKIVSYNIAHGRGQASSNWNEGGAVKSVRIQEIGERLRKVDADIVVLNEVDFCSTWSGHQNQARQIAKVAGYRYCVEQTNLDFRFAYGSWRFGNAILSRFPITNAELIEFPAVKSWEAWLVGSKQGTMATIELSPTQRLRVAAIHLEHRSESIRVESVDAIMEFIDSSETNPLVLAGDFNSTPTGFPDSTQSPDGRNAMDLLLEKGNWQYSPQHQPTNDELTFSTMDRGSVIDWILVASSEHVAKQYRVIDCDLSDHFPIEVTLESRR